MRVQKIFTDTEGYEKLYSVLMTEEELSLFSSAFDQMRLKYGDRGLPVSCRTSDGTLHDGRVQAKTEEEYMRKARKFHQECEDRIKNFSIIGDLDKKSIEFQNGLSRKMANFNKKVVDKVGLGETKLGRAMKNGIDRKAQNQINQENLNLQLRKKLYRYD